MTMAREKAKKPNRLRKALVVSSLSASAEGLSRYRGNSAQVDDAEEARRAFHRADAWARSPAGTLYGEVRK